MLLFITHTLSLCFCTGVNCSTPKQPNHGTVSYNDTGYNMVVVYKCDEGYSLIGSSTRVCQSNGNWSGEEPVCERKHEEFQIADEEEDKISSFHVKSIVAFLFLIFLLCGFYFRGYYPFLLLLVCFIYFKYYFLFFWFVLFFFFLQVLELLQLLYLLYSYFNATFPLIYAIVQCLEAFTRSRRR